MPFQTAVNLNFAPGVAGDFADANPRASVLAGPGALVAGTGGIQAGRFAWVDATNSYALNTGSGLPAGFVHREWQGLITIYLAEAGNNIPQGFEITLFSSGSFWAVNGTGAATTMNQKVFATLADGTVQFGAAGATIAGAIETRWVVASIAAAGEFVKITTHVRG